MMQAENRAIPATDFRSALVVDDHPLFCDALSMTLQAVSGLREVHRAATLGEALAMLREGLRVDLVTLDLNLPDADGIDGLLQLGRACHCPIVVVSSLTDARTISAAMRAGAVGFVPKHSSRDVFAGAMTRLARGEVVLPAGHVATEAGGPDRAADAIVRLATLTAQQARILNLICAGKLNKQIAHDLSIAETTVKTHVTAIMRKLGVQSRTQAVLLAGQVRYYADGLPPGPSPG